MIKCKNCNTVIRRNKKYCSNACKQRAYRMRRNVTVKLDSPKFDENAPTLFEYLIVKELIEKEYFTYHKLTYLEYEFVKFLHPEIKNMISFKDQLLLIKKELDYIHVDSTYKKAFDQYLKSKLL
tara:strand:+ start:645 stop:1016 length:372 start_codon:yes stop_codon:yes gene_type:complete